uniref:Uncharacterized protein LOC111124074 n=1 Tax=Crassostrea virginica TaxID=6565 RepID=A0A8B8D535_CRAVI|nr:uncharacterized protein LOC111124074 [Crassostrea virginica]
MVPVLWKHSVALKVLCVLVIVKACLAELRCFNCQTELAYPRACPFVRKCNSGEVCYVDEFHTPDGHSYYKSGCRSNTTCGTGLSSTGNEHRTCEECCATDVCNSGGCQQPGLPARDRRGPLCYDCTEQQAADDCNRVTVCGLDYDCWIHESLNTIQYQYVYSTGCQRKSFCHVLESLQLGRRQVGNEDLAREGKTTHRGCSVCCSGDLCNQNCSMHIPTP